MSQQCRLALGAVGLSSYCRTASCSLFFYHLRRPVANSSQVRTICRKVLYSDATLGGSEAFSRHRLVLSSQRLHSFQQRSPLSLSAAVRAATAADVVPELDLTLSAPLDTANAVVDVATSAVEPTLKSLGLVSSFPGAWVQAGLESLHIGFDLPWWTAIVIGTICIRLAIFPLVIIGQRNAAEMHNHLPTMQRLQQRMSAERRKGDIQSAMNAAHELTEYMQRNNVKPFRNLFVPMMQIPIFISVYRGLNEMAALPVLSMKSGGLFWFKDLTVLDPYFALPLMTAATLFITVEVGTDSVSASSMKPEMRFIMRLMPVLILPFIAKFPAAMLCYWFTSNTFSLVQVLFLKIPAIRRLCKIPILVDHKVNVHVRESDLPKQSFMAAFRESRDNLRLAQEIQERQHYNTLLMKKPSREETATAKSLPAADSVDTNKKFTQSTEIGVKSSQITETIESQSVDSKSVDKDNIAQKAKRSQQL